MNDLKYRARLSTSIDKGLYKAIYNYSVESKIPLSRLLDDAIEQFLQNKEMEYTVEAPYKRERI